MGRRHSHSQKTAASASKTAGRPARSFVLPIWIAALAVFAVDQLSKWWALENLQGRRIISLIGDALYLKLTFNSGAAFSLGNTVTWIFTALSIIVLILAVRIVPRTPTTGWAIALALFIGGLLGNLTDRLLRAPGALQGHVVDFIGYFDWFIGNIADIALVVAVVVAMVASYRQPFLFHPENADDAAVDTVVSPRAGEAEESDS